MNDYINEPDGVADILVTTVHASAFDTASGTGPASNELGFVVDALEPEADPARRLAPVQDVTASIQGAQTPLDKEVEAQWYDYLREFSFFSTPREDRALEGPFAPEPATHDDPADRLWASLADHPCVLPGAVQVQE